MWPSTARSADPAAQADVEDVCDDDRRCSSDQGDLGDDTFRITSDSHNEQRDGAEHERRQCPPLTMYSNAASHQDGEARNKGRSHEQPFRRGAHDRQADHRQRSRDRGGKQTVQRTGSGQAHADGISACRTRGYP
jgi:hypothetical protein